MKPILFTKPGCSICARAKKMLERCKIPFREVFIHTAEGAAKHAMEMCGGSGADKVPMLKVGDECIFAVQAWAREHANDRA